MEQDRRIAVIGIGCNFPGGSNGWENYWNLLTAGGDAMIPVPSNRWDWRKFTASSNPAPSGKTFLREGGFLQSNIFDFDPHFFGIAPREAETLDPQQRLLLEVTYVGLEDAGLSFSDETSAPVGVFIGAFTFDNLVIRGRSESRHDIQASDVLGYSMTLLANRISYTFNWTGPSLAIDTACSSSLVALHHACESLLREECPIAVAGGVNVMILPETSAVMSKGGFLSPTNRCHTFDAAADGYVRGEGAGVVILKPYAKAVADGDRIHAIIRGTGVNHDGRTAGIALPDAQSQAALLKDLYETAAIDPATVDYIEAHGTGTIVGDSAEVETIHAVFNPAQRNNKLIVSSVKTNIGHLEAAAGVAGLIKAILCLKHRNVPPHLHLKEPNPSLKLEERQIEVPLQNTALPEGRSLLAGVNSFGYGGTNAHAIIESVSVAVVDERDEAESSEAGLRIVTLSARTQEALRSQAKAHAQWLAEASDSPQRLNDWAYTLTCKRSHFGERLTVPMGTASEMATQLSLYADSGELSPSMYSGRAANNGSSVVFVCTGMGPQWWGMGQSLYKTSSAYKEAVDACEELFKKISGESILKEMLVSESETRMSETQIAQPANVILQIGLAAMWKDAGITPAAIVGHSVGEVAAAYLAGVLSLEETLLVSYHRSRLQATLAGSGTMLAVGLGEEAVASWLQPYASTVSLAAINSPDAVTLAGDAESLNAIRAKLNEAEIFNRLLAVEIPYHSQAMDSIRVEMRDVLKSLKPQPAKIPLYSTVTGEQTPGEQWQAGYWWNNARRPVRFLNAFEKLLADGYSIFLEVGPQPVLRRSMQEIAASNKKKLSLVASLHHKEPEREALQKSLGQLHLLGVELPWKNYFPQGNLISLPAYPWQREYYLRETDLMGEDLKGREQAHVFLQKQTRTPRPAWEVEMNAFFFPYLKDHQVQGDVVWPGAAYLEAGLALNLELYGGKPGGLEGLRFFRMLKVDEEMSPRLMTLYDMTTGRWNVASTAEFESPHWQEHADGRLLSEPLHTRPEPIDVETLKNPIFEKIDIKLFYQKLSEIGLQYGEQFQGIQSLYRGENEILCEISLVAGSLNEGDHYQLHPVLVDSAFQAFMAFMREDNGKTWVPVGIDRVSFYEAAHDRVWAQITLSDYSEFKTTGKIRILNEAGATLLILEGITFRALSTPASALANSLSLPQWGVSNMPLMPDEKNSKATWVSIVSGEQREESYWSGLHAAMNIPCEQRIFKSNQERQEFIQSQGWKSWFESENPVPTQWVFFVGQGEDVSVVDEIELLLSFLRHWQDQHEELPDSTITLITECIHAVGTEDVVVDPSSAPLWGMAAVVANEYPEINVRLIDLPSTYDEAVLAGLLAELSAVPQEQEIALRGSQRYILTWELSDEEKLGASMKMRPLVSKQERAVLFPGKEKTLEAVHYRALPRLDPAKHEVEVKISAVGLNFKDLLKVTGRIAAEALEGTFFGQALGLECSGIITRVGADVDDLAVGDRVAAFAPTGCFATHVLTDAALAMQLPEWISMIEGASMVPWCTAHYSLIEQARLQAGEKVLIHSGAGGVGLAAIQIAKNCQAEIYATASTQEKRDYLLSLGVDHVMDSQSLEFAHIIREKTQGYGVDVVLNALSGEYLKQSFALLAAYGRFVEIGKRDIIENQGLPMSVFNRNVSFMAIDLDRAQAERPHLIQASLQQCWDAFSSGQLEPLPQTIFSADKVSDAFRSIASRERIGRVTVSYDEGTVEVVNDGESLEVCSQGCYVVTGGTRGLGLEIAQWLAREGAGQVVLLSRKGPQEPEVSTVIARMQNEGAEVWAPAVDVGDFKNMQKLFADIKAKSWEIKGVLHCALVLEDAFIDSITRDQIENVFRAKVEGARNLHRLTENMPLDFWVCFSSVSTLLGNVGQGSYVAANTYLEQLAVARRQQGLVGTTLLLGYLSDTGVAQRNEGVGQHLEKAGLKGMQSSQVTENLLRLCQRPEPVISFFEIDWSQWASNQFKVAGWSRFQSLLANDPTLRASAKLKWVREELFPLSYAEQQAWVQGYILTILSEITLAPVNKIDVDINVSRLGVDSLMVVELIGKLRRELGVEITNRDLFRDPSIIELGQIILKKLGFVDGDQ